MKYLALFCFFLAGCSGMHSPEPVAVVESPSVIPTAVVPFPLPSEDACDSLPLPLEFEARDFGAVEEVVNLSPIEESGHKFYFGQLCEYWSRGGKLVVVG